MKMQPEPLGPRRVRARAEVVFPASLEGAWSVIVDAHLPDFMLGTRLMPAVVAVEGEDEWGEPGLHRLLRLSDGATLSETVIAAERPSRLDYRIYDVTGPLGRLTRGANGRFDFETVGGGTRIVWTYEYDSRNALVYPLVAFVIRQMFEPYMQQALEQLRANHGW